MTFSPVDAALEGFRIARKQPKAMLIWAAASLVISLVTTFALVSMFGDTMNEMIALNGREPDPADAMAMLGRMGVLYAVLLPIAIIIYAVFTGAVYRAVLKPADGAFGYLRLGATEFRLAVVILVVSLLVFALSILMAIAGAIVVGIVGGIAGASGSGAGVAVAIVLGVLLYIGVLFGVLAFCVKLSFAAPMTFAERRIHIFESWRATKGHFWPLLGSYLLAFVLAMVVSLLGTIISFALMMALGGGGGATAFEVMFQNMQPDYANLSTFFTPAMIANIAISACFSALTYAIMLAPPAVAYRDIVGVRNPVD